MASYDVASTIHQSLVPGADRDAGTARVLEQPAEVLRLQKAIDAIHFQAAVSYMTKRIESLTISVEND
jgi:hypothetical protein